MRSPAAVVRQLVYGPEPIGAADAVALARATARELSGAGGGGTPHYGARGDPQLSWSGWTASPQLFLGNAQMGKALDYVVETYPALPADTAPSAIPSWLAQSERLDNLGLL